jgi:hypothetical protein
MMNKKIWMGMMVILLAFGIVVVGCDNGDNSTTIDKVDLNYGKAPPVSSVTVTKTTNNQHYIVSWDAIEGYVSYQVGFKQDGKKSFSSMSGAQNLYKYDPATGDQIPNDDLDKWSLRVSSLNTIISAAGSYCFGVRTYINDGSITNLYSDVKWGNSITVTAGPQMSAISVTKTTNGSYLIASWDAVAGIDAYNVVLYYKNSSGSWSTYTNGQGQNSQTYSESDGNTSTNTDLTKWSFRYNNITNSGYEGYFAVTPVASDISVLPSSATTPIIK